MQKEFLKKYCPIGRTNQMRRSITSFSQNPGELFHDTWEKLWDLFRKCPIMLYPNGNWCNTFTIVYPKHRQMVDASCGGTFMTENKDEAWEFFDTLSDNSIHHAYVSHLIGHPHDHPKEKWCLRVGSVFSLFQSNSFC